MTDKYILVWVSEETEYQQQGSEPMRKQVAERVRDDPNKRYPQIRHDIKKVQA